MAVVDTTAQAMGTTARFFVHGGPEAIEATLRAELLAMEQRWSRFIASSDVSLINEASGRPVVVHPSTLDLVDHAIRASQQTRAWFDPLLLRALEAAGYSRPFATLDAADAPLVVMASSSDKNAAHANLWPTATARIEVDRASSTVTIPAGTCFDPGGIGKGLAADHLAARAIELGATGALISLGGDIVASGTAPADGWRVAIENPFDIDGPPCAELAVPWGAVATSTVARRRWSTATSDAHHLIDPRTHEPSTSDVVAVTAIAGRCWLAESVAKAAVIAGLDVGLELLEANAMEALLIDTTGAHHLSANMHEYLR